MYFTFTYKKLSIFINFIHLGLGFRPSQYSDRAGHLRKCLIQGRCKTSSGAHPALLLLLYTLRSGVTHLRFEAGSLTASSAEVLNVWYYNFTRPIRFRSVHRDFTLTLLAPALSTSYEGVNVLNVGYDIIKFCDNVSLFFFRRRTTK